jgi:hypothetical protein
LLLTRRHVQSLTHALSLGLQSSIIVLELDHSALVPLKLTNLAIIVFELDHSALVTLKLTYQLAHLLVEADELLQILLQVINPSLHLRHLLL